ncbi:hypothetical protein [Marinobacter subterrani]|uniref:hypothetical protein n=1 Tax=Marinobacter subterrani TaxID=1658765 RepID=UPI002354EC30|nr:hypothetical protein [Marinobacter subterrani]
MEFKPRSLRSAALLVGLLTAFSGQVTAEEKTLELKIPENSVISDGTLTREEMARYIIVAKEQLAYLTKNATEEYAPRMKAEGSAMPAAWMLMNDGVTVKELSLDESAEGAPASIRVVMFRAALKSVARRGKINAAVILYAGQLSEGNTQRALVVEHEHRLGISATKIVPFVVEEGQVKYAQSVTREKPFQMFYDSEADAPGAAS